MEKSALLWDNRNHRRDVYAKEIQTQIGERLGFSKEQIKGYLKRHNKSTQKQNAATLTASVQRLGKTAQLEYEIARKDCSIKQLEMENELLRDFLLLIERK